MSIRNNTDKNILSGKKKAAFITQPRTQSKLSLGFENESLVQSEVLYDTSGQDSQAGNKGILRSRNVADEKTYGNDSGIEDEHGVDDAALKHKDYLDKVFPLPDGWPRLQEKLFKRRALFFRKPTTSNINKVVEQLQVLQDKIEVWSREMELEILSRHSSVASLVPPMSEVVDGPSFQEGRQGLGSKLNSERRKFLRFAQDSVDPGSEHEGGLSSARADSRLNSGASGDQYLSVHGLGAVMPILDSPAVERTPFIEIDDEELPQLGAEEVIDEVVTLLGRLESDRRDAEEGLEKEKQRVSWLQGRIDHLARKRMVELPKAVQKEHEACANDIAELQWHCSYRGRQLSRVTSKVENSEMLNARLKEDIAFVQKHCPLVEEKLELELEAMKRIDEAQEQTLDEVNKTEEKRKKTERKSAEANGKADMERAHIKKELDSVREALNEINHELDEAKALHTSYCHKCNDLRSQLKKNAQEKIVLESRNENSRTADKLEGQKVKQTQEKIVDAEFEHRRLGDEIALYTTKIETMRAEIKKLEVESEETNKVKLTELRNRQQQCNEMEMDIEDIEVKLKACKKKRKADERNVERIKREMAKLESQMQVVEEDHHSTKVINIASKRKWTGVQDKVGVREEKLQSTVEGLKRNHKEETHARTVLQARILADATDFQKLQMEAKKKKERVTEKCEEIEKVVAGVLTDVKGQREKRAERQKSIVNLNEAITTLKKNHEETATAFTKETGDLQPKYKQLQTDYLEKQKKQEFMATRTEFINKKIAEMNQSENFMDRVIKNTSEAIEELNVEFEETSIQLETGQRQHQELEHSLQEVKERLDQGGSKHLEYMQARNIKLQELEAELKEHLIKNAELAQVYRVLQQEFHKLKTELLTTMEKRVGLEASLKDHKQLNSLQIRLHDALSRYFNLRGLYNQCKLQQFEGLSMENAERIHGLQKEMDGAIETISKFLMDQVDGTAMKMVAAAANSALKKEESQEILTTNLPAKLDRIPTVVWT